MVQDHRRQVNHFILKWIWMLTQAHIQNEVNTGADKDNRYLLRSWQCSFFKRSNLIDKSNLRTKWSTAQHWPVPYYTSTPWRQLKWQNCYSLYDTLISRHWFKSCKNKKKRKEGISKSINGFRIKYQIYCITIKLQKRFLIQLLYSKCRTWNNQYKDGIRT